MPEGDTVWLAARRLDRALAGRTLTVFELRVPQLALVDLRGTAVTTVIARGKHLLTRFDCGLSLHSHLRMDGSWYLTGAGQRPSGHPEHLIRARLGNAEWLATGYRVHDLRLLESAREDDVQTAARQPSRHTSLGDEGWVLEGDDLHEPGDV